MKRLFTSIMALAAMSSLALTCASAGSMKTASHHHHAKMSHSCPAGQHWVKGYMRGAKKVHGYCRKG